MSDTRAARLRRWIAVATVGAATAVRVGGADAAPTGLNLIPTTDLVPPRQVSVGVQNANPTLHGDRALGDRPEPAPQIEAGLPLDLEAGIDVVPLKDPEDYQPQLNLKWKPLTEDDDRPAVAVGAAQLGPELRPTFFLVASRTINYEEIRYQRFRAHHRNIKLRGIRVHAGMMRSGNAWRALLGADIEVDDHFIIYADWTSGVGAAVSYGGAIVIDQQNSVTVAVLHGNGEARIVTGVLVSLTHTFAW